MNHEKEQMIASAISSIASGNNSGPNALALVAMTLGDIEETSVSSGLFAIADALNNIAFAIESNKE